MGIPILTVYDNAGNEIPIPAIRGLPGTPGTPGTPGEDGHSPEVTATKSGKVTTIKVDGEAIATVNDGEDGQDGAPGAQGQPGTPGQNGITPTIGNNGNWYLGSTDTGKPSRGVQGTPGTDGADGKSAYASAQDGGYTGTEAQFNSDLAAVSGKQSKITASGVLQGDGSGGVTEKTVDSTPTSGSQNLVTSGGVFSAVSGKADKPTIKTAMDSVAVAGAQYFLGTQSAVNIVLPSNAETGQQIVVVFYSGTTATVLSVTGDCLGDVPVPSANNRYELNFEWDGTMWSLLSVEQAVPTEVA